MVYAVPVYRHNASPLLHLRLENGALTQAESTHNEFFWICMLKSKTKSIAPAMHTLHSVAEQVNSGVRLPSHKHVLACKDVSFSHWQLPQALKLNVQHKRTKVSNYYHCLAGTATMDWF